MSLDSNSNKWITCTLGDIVTFKRGYDLPKDKMNKGKYPVVGSNGIIGHHDEFTTESPGITIGRSGNVGKPFIVKEASWSHNTTLFVEKFKNVDPYFVYYYLKTIDLKQFAGGSAVPTLNRNHIHPIDIRIPEDIIEQKKISTLLLTIDEKISVLNKINKNLEEQLETLYKSYFVYYDDFSNDDLKECDIGLIPKDWKLMSLGEVTSKINEKVGTDEYKVFSAVNTGNLILSEEYFDKQVYSKSIEKYIVVKQKEFAYNPARINIGSIGRNDFDYDGCVSPVYVAFKVEEGYENFMDMYLKSNRFNQWVVLLSSGSVRQTLNYKDFSIIKIAYPPKELVDKFNKIYESYYEVINYNNSVITNLENIRDTLLPKLMSGEIDVSKINCERSFNLYKDIKSI